MLPNSNDVDLLGPWAWETIGRGDWFRQGKSAMVYIDPDSLTPGWAVIYDDYEGKQVIRK